MGTPTKPWYQSIVVILSGLTAIVTTAGLALDSISTDPVISPIIAKWPKAVLALSAANAAIHLYLRLFVTKTTIAGVGHGA